MRGHRMVGLRSRSPSGLLGRRGRCGEAGGLVAVPGRLLLLRYGGCLTLVAPACSS